MSEWLTHVFIAYAGFTILSWQLDRVTDRWIAVGVIGSILPDLSRIELLVPHEIIEYLAGVDFSWAGIHTLIGVILLSAIGALCFGDSTARYRAFVSLLGGAISHLIVDLPQRYADGRMVLDSYLSPLPVPRPPTPGWYVTPDRWVVGVAFLAALVVFGIDRYRQRPLVQ